MLKRLLFLIFGILLLSAAAQTSVQSDIRKELKLPEQIKLWTENNEQGNITKISISDCQSGFNEIMTGSSYVSVYPKLEVSIADFKRFPDLEYLSLSGWGVIDLTGLAELKNLKYLNVSYAVLKRFNEAFSPSIVKLNLSNSRLEKGETTLKFQPEWKNIRELCLDDFSPSAAIQGLEHLPLKWLRFRNYRGKELEFLAGTQVAELDISGDNGSTLDLSGIEGLPLVRLNLGRYRAVRNLRVLGTLTKLEELETSLHGDPDFSFQEISRLPLTRLTLWTSQCIYPAVEAIRLAKLPLKELSLNQVYFADLLPILKMPLTTLRIFQIPVPENIFQELSDNRKLRRLTIGNPLNGRGRLMTGQLDWKELAVFRLKELDLSQCHSIPDWSWATAMPDLEILLLPADVKELAPFKNMEFKVLVATGINDEEFSRQCSKYNITVDSRKINEMVPVSVIR